MKDKGNKIVPLGTLVEHCGRAITVKMVGWVGERYYWLTDREGMVYMLPADVVESSHRRAQERQELMRWELERSRNVARP